MRQPVLVLTVITILSLLLPVSRRYVDQGSVLYETMGALRIPKVVIGLLTHSACVSPAMYYIMLKCLHFLLSIPLRYFLSKFGLDVRSFSGTSFSGLLLNVRIRDSMEVDLRVDEIGFDIRTMRRLRKRIHNMWTNLDAYVKAKIHRPREDDADGSSSHAASPHQPEDAHPSLASRDSIDSEVPVATAAEAAEPNSSPFSSATSINTGSGGGASNRSGLSKRLQLFARGIHVQVYAIPHLDTDQSGDESLWFGVDETAQQQQQQQSTLSDQSKPPSSSSSSSSSSAPKSQDGHVLDKEAQELAAKLARRISNTLRTYAYFASLFAHWVDISVSDITFVVVQNSEMARTGHGVTLHMSNIKLWAESARENRSVVNGAARWISTDIANSLYGIFDWILRLIKIRRDLVVEDNSQRQQQFTSASSNARSISTESAESERMSFFNRSSRSRKRDRSYKYLSTLAIEINDIKLVPGIEGATRRHLNSRWELVKMLVMQDMLPNKNPHDSDEPHRRGPVVNCQRCIIRNDVITSFWGLPKKVDQSIEVSQTHIRAGVIEPLLDEVAVMCISPAAQSSRLSVQGLRALNRHLANILREYQTSAATTTEATKRKVPNNNAGGDVENAKRVAAEAREQVNRMLFQLHEVLSKLRLEHVGIALRVADLVFDLPLCGDAANSGSMIIKPPEMLRWRQHNVEIECGYMWNSISSGNVSTVNAPRLAKTHEAANSISDDTDSIFTTSFDESSGRSKDSTAFIRFSGGQAQATALRTPSMTPDPRAEELQADNPGFKLHYCTLYGEMSAFLSEDLTQRPCPQPIFSLDVGRPELVLDLHTQLALDEAKRYLTGIGLRLQVIRMIVKDFAAKDNGSSKDADSSSAVVVDQRVRALVELVFSEIKAHITVERALYATRPYVPLLFAITHPTMKSNNEQISIRIRHAECHMLWGLVASESQPTENSGSVSSDSDVDSFVTGRGTMHSSATSSEKLGSPPSIDNCSFMPSIKFKLTSSPIKACWEGLTQPVTSEGSMRTLLCVKRGIRAEGNLDLNIEPPRAFGGDGHSGLPRVNINVNVDLGEVSGRLRELEFRKWLSMQPLWLVTRLVYATGIDNVYGNNQWYQQQSQQPQQQRRSNSATSGIRVGDEETAGISPIPPLGKSTTFNVSSASTSASRDTTSESSDSFGHVSTVQERRRRLTSTIHLVYDSMRVTVLACDNEEDVRSGIEHGAQICLTNGSLDIRVNGGSLESPHAFGFRSDVAKHTVHIDCQQAAMFLLSAIPEHSARTEALKASSSKHSLPNEFCAKDLDGYLADTVQSHIVLTRPRFNFSRHKLEPFRSRMIIDLQTKCLAGINSVSSVYRWSVFMQHIKYWSRRNKLARRMATQTKEPSPPDDIIVMVNSEMLDLQGDLVSPAFFDLDQSIANGFHLSEIRSQQSPELRLKMPTAGLSFKKTSQDTDNDMHIVLKGPIATLYGAATPKGQMARQRPQPLVSMKEYTVTFDFLREVKREKLAAQQGVRCNSSYNTIDISFERGAMAFGHQYNMADTIDGYILMQKGCKRIARKSSSTCYPPLPFLESALSLKPTTKMIFAALGNPRTFTPPPLRSLTSVKPPPPTTLSVPEDLPTINLHGPEFSMMVHDDPFETALARIYQTGLQEQRERLSRLSAFETKAEEIRKKRIQEYKQRQDAASTTSSCAKAKGNNQDRNKRISTKSRGKNSKHQRSSGTLQSGQTKSNTKNIRMSTMKGVSRTFSSGDQTSEGGSAPYERPPRIPLSQTFASGESSSHLPPFSLPKSTKTDKIGGSGGLRGGPASASMQNVSTAGLSKSDRPRGRTNSAAAEQLGKSFSTLSAHNSPEMGGAKPKGTLVDDTIGADNDLDYEDIDPYQFMLDGVEKEVNQAYQRLMAVESREWIKAIRKKMMPPQDSRFCEHGHRSDEMHFEEIFDMPGNTTTVDGQTQGCGSLGAQLPYSYVPGSWSHFSTPLGRFVVSPMWISIDTPPSLLEFSQVENYLRHTDPSTPYNLKWTTLIPTRVRIKGGDIRMQLRDFPFPLFCVPDPYRSESSTSSTHRSKKLPCSSYDDFCGGIEISGSLIVAERIACERSLRSVFIPIGPRSRESAIDLPSTGWYVAKSLQFPRTFITISIMMYSAPSEKKHPAELDKFIQSGRNRLEAYLPPLPIMSAWGACYQPVISSLMQRMETATSKSADVSPSLPWWDKLRSRMHFKCRMAVIDAPPLVPNNEAGISQPYSREGRKQSSFNVNASSEGAANSKDGGQMFFLALDGRDPYQVTQRPSGYLFTMRGGVRVCTNEGIPGNGLWDKLSGRGVYSVPTEGSVPASGTLGEFMSLRCEEFLMGVPIIIDRKSALLKSMDSNSETLDGTTPSMDEMHIEAMSPSSSIQLSKTLSTDSLADNLSGSSGPKSWRKTYSDLLNNIAKETSVRYTFVTHHMDRLYYKVLLRLSGGVRLGIGLSSYIPPDSTGYRHNHWEIQPIAPEHASTMASVSITDAYEGYRSSRLHACVSLLCPFTETEPTLQKKSFSDMYLATKNVVTRKDKSRQGGNGSKTLSVSHLREPEKDVLSKPPLKWIPRDVDALVSPMHTLVVSHSPSPSSSSKSSQTKPNTETEDSKNVETTIHDLFFTPLPYSARAANVERESTPLGTTGPSTHQGAGTRVDGRPQSQIGLSSAVVEGVQSYLPLYVSRMMLPVRKGTLYPFIETSDNKLGKCLRSLRLVLDLKDLEIAYTQRDYELKELESKELDMLGLNDNHASASDMAAMSPTPSDIDSGQKIQGAKAEGAVRELKGRVEAFSFNLLLEQTSVELKVGPDAASNGTPSAASNSNTNTDRNRRRSSSAVSQSRHERRMSSASANAIPKISPTKTQTTALRWGVGDASTELDYMDVRLTQMNFVLPLFMNAMETEAMHNSQSLDGLRFAKGTLGELTEFEKTWVSCASIRDLKELDISEALFRDVNVLCVLWSPRFVYFTQRPELANLDDQLDGACGPAADAAFAAATVGNPDTAPSSASDMVLVPSLDAFNISNVSPSLNNSVMTMPESHHLPNVRRSLSTRNRAISDVKPKTGSSSSSSLKGKDAGDPYGSISADLANELGIHRRNISMPWSSTDKQQQQNALPLPDPIHAAQTTYSQSYGGNLTSISPNKFLQRAETQPNATGSTRGSTVVPILTSSSLSGESGGIQLAEVSANDSKSPSSAMAYKSSFQLLELARSRQRRLTVSQSRQPIGNASPPVAPPSLTRQSSLNSRTRQPQPMLSGSNTVTMDHGRGGGNDLGFHRQLSLATDQSSIHNQGSRMVPTGPDPNVIMRDSRSTQAILLCKRKQMLGTAIQHEQAQLSKLSQEFERAPNRYNEQFRKEMVRRAEHIYELGARRKLINRCLRLLGADPELTDSERLLIDMPESSNDDENDLDRDTQAAEKILATLYRHRCLIYSGYLIWTTQVRDKLMRFLYIQDCLTAVEYYLSEPAINVVRKAAVDDPKQRKNEKGKQQEQGDSNDKPDSLADGYQTMSDDEGTEDDGSKEHDGWKRDQSKPPKPSDQTSTNSGTSRQTVHFPKLLRRLRSQSKVGGSNGYSFLRKSKKDTVDNNDSKTNKDKKKRQKKKDKKRRKEGYKSSSSRKGSTNGSNKFDKGLQNVWDDIVRYRPYYSFLVEFLNSQVSLRVDEKTSTSSAVAVAERVQLHRILLCNDSEISVVKSGETGINVESPPDDESIIKTRSMVEVENVQVFTTDRKDFESQAAYFVDCTYGSQLEGKDASQLNAIWPAWIPIELLLSQDRHRTRGIFDDLDDGSEIPGTTSGIANAAAMSESSEESDYEGSDVGHGSFVSDGQSQATPPAASRKKKGKQTTNKYSKAWWLADLSKYKRLMDRNNGLVVYDKANPHRIQGDTSSEVDVVVTDDTPEEDENVEDTVNNVPKLDRKMTRESMDTTGGSGHRVHLDKDSIKNDQGEEVEGEEEEADPEDEMGSGGSQRGITHRANHFSVFLPELTLSCTAEQYLVIYETVTDLLVFIDPEKAAYMDHLNTMLLGMDMDDLRGLRTVIQVTQEALRERMPVIQEWYAIQRSSTAFSKDFLNPAASTALSNNNSSRLKTRAASLLTLDRHRRALEQQLRTAMDLFGAAQKQIKHKVEMDGSEPLTRRYTRGSGVSAATTGARSLQKQGTRTTAATSSVFGGMGRGPKPRRVTNPLMHRDTTASGRKPSMSFSSTSGESLGSSRLSVEGRAQATIARTIHLFISKATWHMLENDGQPLCDTTLRWATLNAVTTSDQATHLLSEIHLLYIVNRLPNPMFTDLVGPYVRAKHEKPDFFVEKMIKVRWSELAPVGGISIVERFEVDVFPLRLQLSYDIAQKLINYLYPPQDNNSNAGVSTTSLVPTTSGNYNGGRRPTVTSLESTPASAVAVNHTPDTPGNVSLFSSRAKRTPALSHLREESPLVNNLYQSTESSNGLQSAVGSRFAESTTSMMHIAQSHENRGQVDEMKKRASSNKTFLNIKIGSSTLCISYQGRKANNLTDLRDFEFHAPTLELRNQVESYYELLMQVKKEYMSVVVQHTGALVKEKFRQLHSRKAWNKTSFGPDLEARKLLIDMDRRAEEDISATVQSSFSSDHEQFPAFVPRQVELSSEGSGVSQQQHRGQTHSMPPARNPELSDDNESIRSSTKAPLSKYMILDPRKLMGKRLPSVLPRNFARLDTPPSTSSRIPLYSAMYLDMHPAISDESPKK